LLYFAIIVRLGLLLCNQAIVILKKYHG